MYPRDFEIAVAGEALVLNLIEITGNAWLTSLPRAGR